MRPRSVLGALLAATTMGVTPAMGEGPEAAPAASLVPAGPGHPIDPLSEDAAPRRAPTPDLQAAPLVEVVEGPAEAPEAEAAVSVEPPEAPAELTLSQREALRFQMKSYLRQVHERIGAAWAAPLSPASAPRREALVTVVIGRDGRVVDARVDKTSRDAGFDRSALRTLGRPFLFPPLPPYYLTDVLEVGLRFADPARPRRR